LNTILYHRLPAAVKKGGTPMTELGLVLLGLLLLTGILSYIKFLYHLRQIHTDLTVVLQNMQGILRLLVEAKDRDYKTVPKEKVLYEQEIHLSPNKQISRFDIKLGKDPAANSEDATVKRKSPNLHGKPK
jgi:hypothetical protein